MKGEEDLPVTPAGRFFLRPEMQTVINCAVGLKFPIDIEACKAELHKTLLKHPRFCSLLVRDERGVEHWRKTNVDMDKHVIVPSTQIDGDDEEVVNGYLADLTVSSPLDETKPLWEIHMLQPQKSCVFRLHHALGDGTSLMSLFLACCKRADDPELPPTIPSGKSGRNSADSASKRVRRFLMSCWLTLVYLLDFVLHSLWVKDTKTPISGGAGVELWPRSLVTAKFRLDDMKMVKNAVNGTINDVLLGMIWLGLARYLALRSDKSLEKQLRITGMAMVNTRQQPGLQDVSNMMKNKSLARWGNQMGYVLLPIYLQKNMLEPLEYVKRAQTMLDKKKLSLEAYGSYKLGALVMSLLGTRIATILNYNIIGNTTFTISNVVGPKEEMMFAGNPITYLRVTITSIPHAIIMHMVSYMGKAEMQILVAKDIVPDAQVLAKCLEDALLDMKDAASTKAQD